MSTPTTVRTTLDATRWSNQRQTEGRERDVSSGARNSIADSSDGVAARITSNGTSDDGDLDREAIFDVLSNARRRYAIEYLKGCDPGDEIELSDLVDYIAARENDVSVAEVDYKQRKRVYSSLRQTHLPKLSDCDLIEYDRSRGTIALSDAVSKVQMHLEYVPENDIPWCYHYLGLTAILGGVVALTGFNVYPFAELSTVSLGVIITTVFGLSAVFHTLYTKRNELGSNVESDR